MPQCFKKRNGEIYLIPKKEIFKELNESLNFDKEIFIKHLKAMDYPFFHRVWGAATIQAFENASPPYSKQHPFQIYINIVKLPAYKNFTFKDSDIFDSFKKL